MYGRFNKAFRKYCTFCRHIPQKYMTCLLMSLNVMQWCALDHVSSSATLRFLVKFVKTNGTKATNSTSSHKKGDILCSEKPIPTLGPLTNMELTFTQWSLTIDLHCYTIIMTNIPVGLICDKHGVKNVIIISALLGTVMAASFPSILSKTGFLVFILYVIILAVIESTVVVSITHLVSHWSSKDEFTVFLALCYAGFPLGAMYGDLLIASLLMTNWSIIFYVLSGTYFLTLILNLHFLYNNPIQSPYTSDEEKAKIRSEVGAKYPERIPWKKIVTDSSVWAIVAGQHAATAVKLFCKMYIIFFLPKIIGVDLLNYYYTYIFCGFGSIFIPILWSLLAQYCINKKMIPALFARTFSAAMGNTIPFFFIILSTYTGCIPESIFLCHALGCAIGKIAVIGTKGNIIDMTRYYCGLIDGIVQGWASGLVGLTLSRLASGFKLKTINDFRLVTCTVGSMSTFLTVLYYVWADGLRAKWDTVETEEQLVELRVQKSKIRQFFTSRSLEAFRRTFHE